MKKQNFPQIFVYLINFKILKTADIPRCPFRLGMKVNFEKIDTFLDVPCYLSGDNTQQPILPQNLAIPGLEYFESLNQLQPNARESLFDRPTKILIEKKVCLNFKENDCDEF